MRINSNHTVRFLFICLLIGFTLVAAAACGDSQVEQEPTEPTTPDESETEEPEEEDISPEQQRIEEMSERFSDPQLPGAFSVFIANNPGARPQDGLQYADVVWEFELEGGITRYLAIFYSLPAEKIGPIRSARLYMVEAARGYDIPLFHAGGNLDALDALDSLGVKSMCDIYSAGGFAWRSDERSAPENLYIGTEQLQQAAEYRGFANTPPNSGFPADWAEEVEETYPLPHEEGIWEKSKDVNSFTLTYANYDNYHYSTSYHYKENTYQKYINEGPLRTADDADVIADNILVVEAPGEMTKPPGEWDWQLDVDITGSGKAWIFSGGRMLQGQWSKEAPEEQIVFTTNDAEKTIQIPPGVTWINHITSREQLSIADESEGE